MLARQANGATHYNIPLYVPISIVTRSQTAEKGHDYWLMCLGACQKTIFL